MLFGSQKVKDNILEIGGISVEKLKSQYGTPLYIYDKKYILDQVELIKENFKSNLVETEVAYASKAFLCVKMAKLVDELGLALDLVSAGEIYTAIKAGFPMERAHLHGNSKTPEELEMAISHNIGTIIIDNQWEFKLIEKICKDKNQKVKGILRLNPGIDAHTHEYIQTSKFDSKFGVSIFEDSTIEFIKDIANSNFIDFDGIHCHIGSQIFDEHSFIKAAEVMTDYIKELKSYNIKVKTLNLGGGFGIYYSNGDSPVDLSYCLKRMVKAVEERIVNLDLDVKKLQIEPGRSIVANAGTTIYNIQGLKTTYSGKNYYFIDGGMTDNIRPALYQAKYSGEIANKINFEKTKKVTVAGKCCESGDIIIKDEYFQEANIGDTLAVFGTGAYTYSMASNYNKINRSAVIMVEDGKSELMIKRETYEDIIKNDVL